MIRVKQYLRFHWKNLENSKQSARDFLFLIDKNLTFNSFVPNKNYQFNS